MMIRIKLMAHEVWETSSGMLVEGCNLSVMQSYKLAVEAILLNALD